MRLSSPVNLLLITPFSLSRSFRSVGVKFIFKSSFDKANRTNAKSFRGPGMDEGLKVCLSRLRIATYHIALKPVVSPPPIIYLDDRALLLETLSVPFV